MTTLRRQFELLPGDQQFLEEYGLPWETIVDGSQWVLVHDFSTHEGYNHPRVIAAVRMETGYPNTELNMVYFFPALARKDGRPIGAADAMQPLDGKSFQRWSRHRTGQNPWKIGRDNLGTHIILVEDWLPREFEKCPLP
jgi:Prokaryotic E2 family E